MKRKLIPVEKAAPLHDRIREILVSAKVSASRSVNSTQVVAYWLVGREIVEEEQRGKKRAGYGEKILRELESKLKQDFGSGFAYSNLKYIKQFYLTFPSLINGLQIGHAVRGQYKSGPMTPPVVSSESVDAWQPGMLNPNLCWMHYRTLLKVEKSETRSFYEIESVKNNWTARELERQINSLFYERLALSRDKTGLMRLAKKGQEVQKSEDVFKDPFVMEFLGLPESHKLVESKIEEALINNMQTFLLELGKGFAFVSRQERLSLDGDHFYVDLVFYHTVLKCYVLIDLKTSKLTHTDLGQIQLYVNYYDQERRTKGDNPTLGLILCTDKNDAVVKYTLGADQQKKIFTSRYKFHLPTEAELQAEMRRELRMLDPSGDNVAKIKRTARARNGSAK